MKESDVKKLFKNETNFWIEILTAWSKINFHEVGCKEGVMKQVLWYNSHIRIGNKPVLWNAWLRKGLINVSDIVEDTGHFKHYEELEVEWLLKYCFNFTVRSLMVNAAYQHANHLC